METSYKILLFLFFFLFAITAGIKIYLFLNNKIKSSETGWGLLGFSLLLLAILGALFFGSLYALIASYNFLSEG